MLCRTRRRSAFGTASASQATTTTHPPPTRCLASLAQQEPTDAQPMEPPRRPSTSVEDGTAAPRQASTSDAAPMAQGTALAASGALATRGRASRAPLPDSRAALSPSYSLFASSLCHTARGLRHTGGSRVRIVGSATSPMGRATTTRAPQSACRAQTAILQRRCQFSESSLRLCCSCSSGVAGVSLTIAYPLVFASAGARRLTICSRRCVHP